MARKRKQLGKSADKKIASMAARGATAKTIAKSLRGTGATKVSARTVSRRMREVRGDVAPKRVSARADLREKYKQPPGLLGDDSLPATPEAIPEGTDLETIGRWLKRAEEMAKVAVTEGDLAAMGQMGRLTSALLEAKRKATPPERQDPNESPDMRALGEKVQARFLKFVDDIVGSR